VSYATIAKIVLDLILIGLTQQVGGGGWGGGGGAAPLLVVGGVCRGGAPPPTTPDYCLKYVSTDQICIHGADQSWRNDVEAIWRDRFYIKT
jgi:hypothetical protein